MESNNKSRIRWRVLVAAVALAVVLSAAAVRATSRSQGGQPAPPTPPSPHLSLQEPGGELISPTITRLDSPSPTCSRPAPATGACTIRWEHVSVEAASGSYVMSMTVAIDGRLRGYHAGFFQTTMTIPFDMIAPGYGVTCGMPAPGDPGGWGNSYTYAIKARDSTGLVAENYGSVTCPGDQDSIYIPLVRNR